MFARSRSFIFTAKKQGINALQALTEIFDGDGSSLIRRATKLPP